MSHVALWVLAVIAGGVASWLAVAHGQGLASQRADRLRRFDDRAADIQDQMRFSQANPAALPMRNRDFDRPR